RHTRFSRDWSSDVCSSDLGAGQRGGAERGLGVRVVERGEAGAGEGEEVWVEGLFGEAAAEIVVRRTVVAQLLLRDAEPAEEVGVVRPGLEGFAEHPGHVVPLPLVTEGKGAFEDLVDGTSHFTHQTSRAGPHGPAPGSSA